jgi:hypothetical protein
MPDLLQITVKLSGHAATVAGETTLEYALVPPARLSTVLTLVGLRRPGLAALLPACRFTVNGDDAGRDAALAGGDVVEILSFS